MKPQTLIGYDFGIGAEVSWYPPVAAVRFVCQVKKPKGANGAAWVDPKAMVVKLWRRGRWQAVAKVTATGRT
jgi:hypothetical protein